MIPITVAFSLTIAMWDLPSLNFSNKSSMGITGGTSTGSLKEIPEFLIVTFSSIKSSFFISMIPRILSLLDPSKIGIRLYPCFIIAVIVK